MKVGRFHDYWRGNGWFVAFQLRGSWLLFAFRPKHWWLRLARPPAKPGVIRLYIGPFEVERTRRAPPQGTGL